ncbi:hypothetical protein K435DRAFT_859778 [Dendrothele bispora CBS 962.96]|uniref:Uncharacterized protein n=1 Tax=Dendrothele bispora (strain CBS 962.96) TaxID=1314807 RepID=A0A4S8M0B9_DENBC|nr:hypothetical protein K435DRAFT_859778 [Dendrothele bispora CBS 962.96]
MFFFKSFVVAAAVALVSATPAVESRAEGGLVARQNSGNNCQNFLGNCFQNGCVGTFANPSDTIGTCTAGNFNGCPCAKCGSGNGFVGGCADNGCNGVQGICTAGQFQGCPCK